MQLIKCLILISFLTSGIYAMDQQSVLEAVNKQSPALIQFAQGVQRLVTGIELGDGSDAVKWIQDGIKSGINPCTPIYVAMFNPEGNSVGTITTVCHQAAMGQNNIKLLEFLSQHGVDFKKVTCMADTDKGDVCLASCIEWAATKFSTEVVRFLMKQGVSPNTLISPDYASPLLLAWQRGEKEMCKVLLDYNANIHMKQTPMTPYELSFGTSKDIPIPSQVDVRVEGRLLTDAEYAIFVDGFNKRMALNKELAELIRPHDGRVAAQAYVFLRGWVGLGLPETKLILDNIIPDSDSDGRVTRSSRFLKMISRSPIKNALARAATNRSGWKPPTDAPTTVVQALEKKVEQLTVQ
jgi:ankyrin repeat protein